MDLTFTVGDKLYKIINGSLDTTKVFEIESIILKEDIDWSNDLVTQLVATLVGDVEPYTLSRHIYGYIHSKEVFAVKIEE
jgi:hypothetical protein